jgi:hypothetical protein
MEALPVSALSVAAWRIAISGGRCERLQLYLESELAELPDETPGPDLDGTLFEVVAAKILVGGTIFQHVVDRGEQ